MDYIVNFTTISIPFSIWIITYSFYKVVGSYICYNNNKIKVFKRLTGKKYVNTKLLFSTNICPQTLPEPISHPTPPESPVYSNNINEIDSKLTELSNLFFPIFFENEDL
jgi:hypothetical protein